jgi:hypothetical protein
MKKQKYILDEITNREAADAFVAEFNQFIEDVRPRRPWKAIIQLLERKQSKVAEVVKGVVTKENKDLHNFYAGQLSILEMLLKSDGMGLHHEMEAVFAAQDLMVFGNEDQESNEEGGEEE